MRFLLLSTAIAVSLGSSCATTTKFVSDPPGATVTSKNAKKIVGKTPFAYETSMWIWESDKVSVKAPGHKERIVELKRSEADLVPLIGGICLTPFCCSGVPIILAGGFKLPEVTRVKLEKDDRRGGIKEDITPGDAVAMGY
jgi:hypothetical protein